MSEVMHLYIAKSSIVKKISLLIIVSLLTLSCSSLTSEHEGYHQGHHDGLKTSDSNSKVDQRCLETRGAIDIGSGTSKLVVAVVNRCEDIIDHVLFEAQRAISFKEALQNSKENKFNRDIINKAVNGLNELRYIALQQGANKIRAVATSAFRTADNAQEVKALIEKKTNLKIKVITQTDEALFAYHSAISMAKSNKLIDERPVAVWDIGGGSMQIIKNNGQQRVIYLGKLASVSFKNKLIKDFELNKKTGPNPLGKKKAINAMGVARNYANSHAKPILGELKGYQVLGVGGVHFFSVRKQVKSKTSTYDQGLLLDTLLKRAKLNDKQIGTKYAKTDVTNLALVLGFMQSLSIDRIMPLKINMAHGVLTNKDLWTK